MRVGIKGIIRRGREEAKNARDSIEDFKRDDGSLENETNPYGFPFG